MPQTASRSRPGSTSISDLHEPFQEALSRASRESPRWHRANAGLSVLLLVDRASPTRRRALGTRQQFMEVRRAIAPVRPASTRAALMSILDVIVPGAPPYHAMLETLKRYADRLEQTGEFALAGDVYWTMIDLARDTGIVTLLAYAYWRLGTCSREQGHRSQALEAYEAGLSAARLCADQDMELRIRIAKGNLCGVYNEFGDAMEILPSAFAEAQELGCKDLMSRAAHEIGIVHQHLRRYTEALDYHFVAFENYPDREQRTRILNDIGCCFLAMGHYEPARNACLVSYLAGQGRDGRWASAITLMAIANAERNATLFDQYQATLEKAPMPARIAVLYHIELGDGSRVFGREKESRAAYQRAADIAGRFGFEEEEDDALKGLSGSRDATNGHPKPPDPTTARIDELIQTVKSLRALPRLVGRMLATEPGQAKPPTLRRNLGRGPRPRVDSQ